MGTHVCLSSPVPGFVISLGSYTLFEHEHIFCTHSPLTAHLAWFIAYRLQPSTHLSHPLFIDSAFILTHSSSAHFFYALFIGSASFLYLFSSALLYSTLSLTIHTYTLFASASPAWHSLRRQLSYMFFTCASLRYCYRLAQQRIFLFYADCILPSHQSTVFFHASCATLNFWCIIHKTAYVKIEPLQLKVVVEIESTASLDLQK